MNKRLINAMLVGLSLSTAATAAEEWVKAGIAKEDAAFFQKGWMWQVDAKSGVRVTPYVYFSARGYARDQENRWHYACFYTHCDDKTVSVFDCLTYSSEKKPDNFHDMEILRPWREWGPVGNAAEMFCQTNLITVEEVINNIVSSEKRRMAEQPKDK